MKKWNSFFRIFFQGCSLIFSCQGHITIFPVFSAQKCFKIFFFSGRNKLFFCFPKGGQKFFLSRRLEIVVPREGKNPCCPQGLPLLSQGIIFVLRGDESAQRAPKDKNYPEGQQGQALGTTRILTLPRDNNFQPEGQKTFLPSRGKTIKSLFLPEKKKILKHFWAENTGKIVIWPWQEKIRLQP